MRLALPVGIQLLAGIALVFYALHGWDRKYGTFSGSIAGEGAPAESPAE